MADFLLELNMFIEMIGLFTRAAISNAIKKANDEKAREAQRRMREVQRRMQEEIEQQKRAMIMKVIFCVILIAVCAFFAIRHHIGSSKYKLGMTYIEGEEATQDYNEGVKYLKKSSWYGNKKAPMQLALCYLNGTGVTKDEKEALNWYAVAAKRNNSDAQLALARCYSKGEGVELDEKKAFKWYKKAAKHKNTEAQVVLQIAMQMAQVQKVVTLWRLSGIKKQQIRGIWRLN